MQRALIIGKTWPEPKTTGAGRRMMQIVKSLEQHFELHFASAAQISSYSTLFDCSSIKTHFIKINNDDVDRLLLKINPGIVVFDRFSIEEQFGWRVAEFAPKALRILNMEDFHGLRIVRASILKNFKSNLKSTTLLHAVMGNEIVQREIASIYRCDRTWVIATGELDMLKDLGVPDFLLHHLPFNLSDFYDPNGFKQDYLNRENFVFFGNFYHAPNIDAIEVLRDIWPIIHQKLPSVELHIYGAYGDKVKGIKKLPRGMVYKGWEDSIVEILSTYKLLLAPLRFGAGVKTKIIESIGSGLPVISTPIGWEDIFNRNDAIPGVFCEDDVEFIDEAVRLYQSEALWTEYQDRAKVWCSKFSDQWEIDLIKAIAVDLKEMEANRMKNIVGKILHWNSHKK